MRKWWRKGIRFECQGSGRCCVSRGVYGFVYLTLQDRKALADHLGITTRKFTSEYCQKTEGLFHLKEVSGEPNCRFLTDNRCAVYEARPTQCRTWPFWPDHMGSKTWALSIASFCPGVGKGRLHSEEEIQAVLDQQKKSDSQL